MAKEEATKIVQSDLGKSVSTHREARDSQTVVKPHHLQQPDSVALPPIATSQQGNAGTSTGASHSVVNQSGSKKNE